jgi:prevent-host-death family protein
MRTVNVHEAKAKLSELIERALEGEEIVIARRNVPLVRLTVVEAAESGRRLGWARGLIEIAPDFDETPADFDDYS